MSLCCDFTIFVLTNDAIKIKKTVDTLGVDLFVPGQVVVFTLNGSDDQKDQPKPMTGHLDFR